MIHGSRNLLKMLGQSSLTEQLSTDVIKENGRVVGVKTERGDVLADVVIAADGVNSMLSKQAGLRDEPPLEAAGIGSEGGHRASEAED